MTASATRSHNLGVDDAAAGANVGSPRDERVRELRRRTGWQSLGLGEVWQARDLVWRLALRDIQVRYKQTALGALWAILQPLGMMVVLEYVLTVYLGQPSDPVGRYAKLLPWTLFAAAVLAATNSLVSHADMLRKIYFPRLVLPLAATGAPLIDFAIALLLLLVMVAWSAGAATWQLLALPLLAASTLVAALGVGIAMSALSVRYRDVRHVVPFLVSIGFFLSGILYDLPAGNLWLNLNPISGSIAAFGAAVTGQPIDWPAWAVSTAVAAGCLAAGVAYFARVQRRFADVV